MEVSQKICPECGSPVPAGAPRRICPNCLLRLGERAEPAEAALMTLDEVASPLGPGATPAETANRLEQPGARIGRYKLLEPIGEGGFGAVWMAEQQEPVRRRVALKIIKLGMDTKEVIARFEAERQALAMMDHPNIARVFDGGATDNGRPYFVMELVKGVRITDYCDAARLSTEERLKLFIQVCQAVQHAHQKGVIHRDLKPSNVLVTVQDDQPVPKVIDFGIAKATEQQLTDKTFFTRFNQIIGTPAYMSPEQAGLGGLDIYALGVLLYELLTGRTPFSNEELLKGGLDDVLRTIREKEPPRPSTRLSTLSKEDLLSTAMRRGADPARLNRQVRGELDWIVMKALEKDRTRRYESPNGLACDIERFLSEEPVTAVAPTLAYQFTKFARRNRGVLAVGMAFVMVLATATAITAWQALRATRLARTEARMRRDAQQNLYVADMNLAQDAFRSSNLRRARDLLERHRPVATFDDLRGWEWFYLWSHSQGGAGQVPTGGAANNIPVKDMALSPDDRHLALVQTPNLQLLDLATGKEVAAVRCSSVPSGTLSFGKKLLAIAEQRETTGRVRLFRVPALEELPAIDIGRLVCRAALSPDGRWLACLCRTDNNYYSPAFLQLWNMDNYKLVGEIAALWPVDDRFGAIAWTRSSRTIALAEGRGRIRLFGLPEGVEEKEIAPTLRPASDESLPPQSFSGVTAIAFSPDEQLLAVAADSLRTGIEILAVNDGHSVTTFRGHGASVTAMEFTPDARMLASASTDQTVRLWDLPQEMEVVALRGHLGPVSDVAISKDGQTLFSSGLDGAVFLWTNALRTAQQSMEQLAENVFGFTTRGVVFSPDSALVAMLGRQGAVRLIPLNDPSFSTSVAELGTNNTAIALSPDGLRLYTGTMTGEIRIYDIAKRRLVEQVKILPARPFRMEFLKQGTLATMEHDRGTTNDIVCRVWNTDWTPQVTISFPVRSSGQFACFVDQDTVLLTASDSGKVRLYSTSNGQLLTNFHAHQARIGGVAASPNGDRFATAGSDGSVIIWQTSPHRKIAELRGHLQAVEVVAFSPDGLRLATGSAGDDAVKIWDLHTLQEVLKLRTSQARIYWLTFSPDGSTLAAVDYSGKGYLWRAPQR